MSLGLAVLAAWPVAAHEPAGAEPVGAAPASAAAEAEAERMLAAVGGRAAWAALRNTVNDSQQYRSTDPVEVRAVITIDFTQPRWRIDTSGPGLRLVRSVHGEGARGGARDWRLTRGGQIAAVSAATREEDLRWYAGHLYRTIHRIARRDPALSLRLGEHGRLDVVEAGPAGRRLAWFRLTTAGEPFAYGGSSGSGDAVQVSGPWTVAEQGIKHPAWTAAADGTWRSSLNRLRVNVTLADADFEPP